jgi:transcriptional regulator with XRE-family HTH domain
MVETTQLREKLEAARDTFDYRLEKVLFDVAEQVCKLLESQGKTRAELAKLLDVTPAYVTKILNGNPNLTIKSLLKLSDALGQTLAISVTPRFEIIKVASASQSTPLTAPITTEYSQLTQTLTVDKASTAHEANNNELALAA